MFLVTDLARQEQAQAAKSRNGATVGHTAAIVSREYEEDQGFTNPLNPGFPDGDDHVDIDDGDEEIPDSMAETLDDEVSEKSSLPAGRSSMSTFLDSHGVGRVQMYPGSAPVPQAHGTIGTVGSPALGSSMSNHPGTASVNRLDLRHGAAPAQVIGALARPAFHTAPNSAVPQPTRGGGPAAPMSPGSH